MGTEEIRRFWEAEYAGGGYRERWDYAHPSQELVSAVAALGGEAAGRALDLGGGAGTEAVFLARSGYRTACVDVSPTALRIAAERAEAAGVELELLECDALHLEAVADGSIDFANDRGCFHHIDARDRDRYAGEVARVLRPGGLLLLRGCRLLDTGEFVPVTEASIDRHFDRRRFRRGPVLPIELVSDAGSLPSHIVYLWRR